MLYLPASPFFFFSFSLFTSISKAVLIFWMLGPLWNEWLSHHGLLFRFDSKHLPLIKHIILLCYQGSSPTMRTLIVVEGLLLFCPSCCLSPGEMPPLCYACLFQLTPFSLLCRLSFPHTLHSVSKHHSYSAVPPVFVWKAATSCSSSPPFQLAVFERLPSLS